MSRLGWIADGIERARAAGGVEIERYRRPGFVETIGVRVVRLEGRNWGSGIYLDPEPDSNDSYDERK